MAENRSPHPICPRAAVCLPAVGGLIIFLILSACARAAGLAPVNLDELIRTPDKYLGQQVVVEGVLEARGRTYPPQYLLRGASGATLAVTPWAPFEVLHRPQGQAGPRGMPEYLGRRLRLTGRLARQQGELVLKVDSAKML